MNFSRRSFFKAIPVAFLVPSLTPDEDLFMPVYEDSFPEYCYMRLYHIGKNIIWERRYNLDLREDFMKAHGLSLRYELIKEFLMMAGPGKIEIEEGIITSDYTKKPEVFWILIAPKVRR